MPKPLAIKMQNDSNNIKLDIYLTLCTKNEPQNGSKMLIEPNYKISNNTLRAKHLEEKFYVLAR